MPYSDCALTGPGRDQRPGHVGAGADRLAQRVGEREREHSQPRDQVLIAADHFGEAQRVVLALGHGHRQLHPLAGAQHFQLRHVAGGAAVEVDVELPAVLDRLAVERQHDVADAQAGGAGRPAAVDVGDDRARVLRQLERPGHHRCDRLHHGADRAALDAPVGLQLFVDGLDDVAGGREPQALVAAALGQQQRVDAYQLAGGVHQWTAAAPRVDRRVGLDVDHRVVGLELPSHRAHHAHRHRVVETERAAEREHQLPGAQPIGVADRERRQRRAAHLEQRQVGLLVHAGDLGVERPAARADDRLALDTRAKYHLDAACTLHDVVVGHHEPGGVHDYARARRPLLLDQSVGGRSVGVDDQPRSDHLHHAGAHPRGQRLERRAQLVERREGGRRARRLGLHRLRRGGAHRRRQHHGEAGGPPTGVG